MEQTIISKDNTLRVSVSDIIEKIVCAVADEMNDKIKRISSDNNPEREYDDYWESCSESNDDYIDIGEMCVNYEYTLTWEYRELNDSECNYLERQIRDRDGYVCSIEVIDAVDNEIMQELYDVIVTMINDKIKYK